VLRDRVTSRPLHVGRGIAVFVVLIVICASLGDGWCESVDITERPDALLLYANARDIWYGKRGGGDQLEYHVDERFPASNVIDWISHKLQEKGWQPLANDFLNPGLLSSQVQGWQGFLDETKGPTACIQQWMGYWKDASGDIVLYAFRYRQPDCSICDLDDPKVTSNLTDLFVIGVYLPTDVAQQTVEAVKQFYTEHPLPK
jgi:hypothetical protein